MHTAASLSRVSGRVSYFPAFPAWYPRWIAQDNHTFIAVALAPEAFWSVSSKTRTHSLASSSDLAANSHVRCLPCSLKLALTTPASVSLEAR
jgi:hypothetical protein